jgi:hypothetical protein
MRTSTITLTLLLLLSVAVNVVMWRRAPSDTATSAEPRATPAAPHAQTKSRVSSCPTRVVTRVVEREAACPPTTTEVVEVCDHEDVLAAVAEEHLRQHWRSRMPDILDGLWADLDDPDWIDGQVDDKVDRHRDLFAPGTRDLERLGAGYERIWNAHAATLHELVEEEDFTALIDEVRAFWEAEDALVAEVLGEQRKDVYVASDSRGRTTILAILLAFADEPWTEDALTW